MYRRDAVWSCAPRQMVRSCFWWDELRGQTVSRSAEIFACWLDQRPSCAQFKGCMSDRA